MALDPRMLKQAEERDRWLIEDLISVRKESGMTVEDVAFALGISVKAVEKFEAENSDPYMSTIRRYASAVSARYKHELYIKQPDKDEEIT